MYDWCEERGYRCDDLVPDVADGLYDWCEERGYRCDDLVPDVGDYLHETIPGVGEEFHDGGHESHDAFVEQNSYRNDGDEKVLPYICQELHETIPSIDECIDDRCKEIGYALNNACPNFGDEL